MNAPVPSVVKAMTLIEPARQRFDAVLSDKTMNFDREASFAAQVLGGNDYALSIALANPQSVISAVTNVAAIGITLNPAKKQAYLVPRDGRICLDISYMGLIDMATSSGSIRWAQAGIVREGDTFRLQGYDRPPIHEFDPFDAGRGEVRGVYTVAKTADGDFLTHAMPIAAIHAIRNRSAAWKAWQTKKKSCPWVTDPDEMAKKTCLKQASKLWPRVDRLSEAIQYLNTEGDEGLDLEEGAVAQDASPEVPAMPRRRSESAATQPRADVTDVPHREVPAQAPQPTEAAVDNTPATEGERKWVELNISRCGLSLQDALAQLGLASLDGLTKTDFGRARDLIRSRR